MKKLLLAIALIMGAGISQETSATTSPKHRYQQTVPVQADTAGIEAYSDTTSVAENSQEEEDSSDDLYDTNQHRSKYDPTFYNSPFDYFGEIFGKGFLATFIILLIILGFLIVLAPFIIIVLVLRYLNKRRKEHIQQETVSIKDDPIPYNLYSTDEFMVRRGVRNIFIGIGLAVMFGIWGWDPMVGISALIIFYGLGQCVIALLPVIKKLYHKWQDGIQ